MIKEDETRRIRVVVDVRNINIFIKFWHDVEVEALKANDIEKALVALTYIKTFQEARAAHGIGPLELDLEEEEPIVRRLLAMGKDALMERHLEILNHEP